MFDQSTGWFTLQRCAVDVGVHGRLIHTVLVNTRLGSTTPAVVM